MKRLHHSVAITALFAITTLIVTGCASSVSGTASAASQVNSVPEKTKENTTTTKSPKSTAPSQKNVDIFTVCGVIEPDRFAEEIEAKYIGKLSCRDLDPETTDKGVMFVGVYSAGQQPIGGISFYFLRGTGGHEAELLKSKDHHQAVPGVGDAAYYDDIGDSKIKVNLIAVKRIGTDSVMSSLQISKKVDAEIMLPNVKALAIEAFKPITKYEDGIE